jgi:hypothetical protein
VARIRQAFVEEGWEKAMHRKVVDRTYQRRAKGLSVAP